MTEEVIVEEDAQDGFPLEYVWYDPSHGCVYISDANGKVWRQEFVITEEEKVFDDEGEFYKFFREENPRANFDTKDQ